MPDGFGSAMATEMLRGGNAEIYTESIINGHLIAHETVLDLVWLLLLVSVLRM